MAVLATRRIGVKTKDDSGLVYSRSKGMRKHIRRVKAGLVRTGSGKFIRLKEFQRAAANEKNRAGKLRKAIAMMQTRQEAEKVRVAKENAKLNSDIRELTRAHIQRSEVVRVFLREHKTQVIAVLSARDLPYTSDERVLSQTTKHGLNYIITQNGFYFIEGTGIYQHNGEKI